MKKFFCLMFVFLLACGVAAAEYEVEFSFETPVSVDLNGDGEIEEIRLQMIGTDEEASMMLVLIGGDGGVNTFMTDVMYDCTGGAMDLNGDGSMEIYLSGDQFSDDYFTWCLRYTDEGLKIVSFPDFGRDSVTDGKSEFGYGRISDISKNALTLTGSQDVLGTWSASRTLSLNDDHFEFSDDGLFETIIDFDDPYLWETRCLTLTKSLNVVLEDETSGTLEIGEKFVITKSDLQHVVYFVTQDGISGHFEIEPNEQDGWGSCIEGLAEYEYFEYLPYAD